MSRGREACPLHPFQGDSGLVEFLAGIHGFERSARSDNAWHA